jgi:hypothetical protein
VSAARITARLWKSWTNDEVYFPRRLDVSAVIAPYRRISSVGWSDLGLLVEAASLMMLVSVGLRLLRFPTLRRILDAGAGSHARGAARACPAQTIARVRWAIATAGRLPIGATCLVEALAADLLVRRRGVISVVRIGVRVGANASTPLEAHAWVECDGKAIVGELHDLHHFTVLTAQIPDAGASNQRS